MFAMPIVELILFVLVVILVKYNWSRRKLYWFAAKLSGPPALPLIGNGLLFRCKPDEIYDVLVDLFSKYTHPMRVWMGPQLFVIFSDLRHVEKIMSSPQMATKAEFYKFMGEYGPSGLIHASGPRWKEHRRMIQPLLNLKYAYMNINVIQNHINKLMQKMDTLVDGELFDVQHILHPCCFDIIGEIILGENPKTQEGNQLVLIEYFREYYVNVFTQMIKPWLNFEPIFNITQLKKDRDVMVSNIREYARKALDKSKSFSGSVKSPQPVISQIIEILKDNPNLMNEEEFIDNLLTLYAASEDTSTIISSAICLCFGMYPEYQVPLFVKISSCASDGAPECGLMGFPLGVEDIFFKYVTLDGVFCMSCNATHEPRETKDLAYLELKDVLGTRKTISVEDLSCLKYLEMCIKDALRLFPIGPFLVRQTIEEFSVDNYTIPTGCQVLIPVHYIHRDLKHWEHPMHFYPNHFLPEVVANRNAFAYMPFSTGPRSCIGLHVAMQTLKLLTANLLLKYRFEAYGKVPDIHYTAYISLRVKDGYNIKIKRRNNNVKK